MLGSTACALAIVGRPSNAAASLNDWPGPVRRGTEMFAIGGTCSHYGGPLAEGLVVDDTIRCPWHHACFSLRTGEALRTPALKPVACYDVVEREGRVVVTGKQTKPSRESRRGRRARATPSSVGIVGAGAAGTSAAEELRRLGFEEPITSSIGIGRRRTIGRICPRTTWRGPRRTNRFRFTRAPTMTSAAWNWCWAVTSRHSIPLGSASRSMTV